jgi:hypothetical protein
MTFDAPQRRPRWLRTDGPRAIARAAARRVEG